MIKVKVLLDKITTIPAIDLAVWTTLPVRPNQGDTFFMDHIHDEIIKIVKEKPDLLKHLEYWMFPVTDEENWPEIERLNFEDCFHILFVHLHPGEDFISIVVSDESYFDQFKNEIT